MEEKEKTEKRKNNHPAIKVIDKRHSATRAAEESQEDGTAKKKYPSYIEELRSELDKKDKILKEYIESYKKIKKENDDFRIRLKNDMERRVEAAKIDFVGTLIGIFDNLDRAIEAASSSKNI